MNINIRQYQHDTICVANRQGELRQSEPTDAHIRNSGCYCMINGSKDDSNKHQIRAIKVVWATGSACCDEW